MYNYSPEELIQYLYNETSPTTTAAIEQALKQDWTLREKLAVLKTSMERLNSITQSPRTETVLAILKYAIKTQTVSTN
jgi:anti-sigma factor RsiW